MTTNDATITAIIERESSESTNHPADHGGPTKYGLSQRFLSALCNRPVPTDEIKFLTEQEARSIYLNEFILGPNFHRIDDPELREQVIDAGVNHNPAWAARRLQEIVGVKADGRVGPITLKAVNFANKTNGIANQFVRRRAHKYVRIVQADLIKRYGHEEFGKMQAVFLAGWIRRALSFLET